MGASQIESALQENAVYEASKTAQAGQKKTPVYGKTVGKPELSEKGQKYYEELKKKFSNMDFILVSNDMKQIAKSQAGSYANPNKMVVLIDEEKIERMAEDENFRKQYEGVIRSTSVKLPQLQKSLASTPGVKSYGMQVNDGGNASFFAVVDKSLAAQRDRISKNKAKKAEEKKAAAKKDAKKAQEEKRTEKQAEKAKEEDTVTVTASSIDELIRKINDVFYEEMSNSVQTDEEKMIGQHFDFRW